MQRRTTRDHLARTGVRMLGLTPEWMQRIVAGAPITIDGQRLHTEVQAGLKTLNSSPGAHFETLTVADARAAIDHEAWLFGSEPTLDVVEDITIPTPHGGIAGRRYIANVDAPLDGVLVYFHGGGWVLGSLDSGDATCRFFARDANVMVIAVDYRLAPEHVFPAAVDDAVAAFRWARDLASVWGVLPSRVAVGGDSAGGNLAAVVAQQTAADADGAPAFQMLFFPVTDLSKKSRSYELFGEGFFLTEAQMDWYTSHYLADPDDALDPRCSPLLAEDVSGVAPAYVGVSGFDPLRDEGIAYAARLEEAGVPTELKVHTGHIHGFVNATGVGRTSTDALRDAARSLTTALQWAPVRVRA